MTTKERAGQLVNEWVKENYPLMYQEQDFDELDFTDMLKFAEWLITDVCKKEEQKGNGVLPCVSGSASHIWDKEKGIKIAGKPWVGIKSKTVRTCTVCNKKEYWTNDGMFCGWFSTP